MLARQPTPVLLFSLLVLLTLTPGGATAQRATSYDGPLENVVATWNFHAVDAFINTPTGEIMGAGQPPAISILHLAMVHGAIYDAVMTIDGSYQPYLTTLPRAPQSASKAAAVATAAHDVLVGIRLPTPLNPAISDGRYGPYRFPSGEEPGRFRFKPSDPPTANRFDWVAAVEPFLLESASQFRTPGPHALTSDAYAKDYEEVRTLGAATGSARTPAQEELAQFYNLNPVELLFRAFRTLAVDTQLTLVEQARLFAMLGMANADSVITCWADKGHWAFWRPSTAIPNGERDGNPTTVGDPAWAPLLPDPPYPDHPSGFNCSAAAFMHTATAFFGTDEVAFSVVKRVPGAPDVTRSYARFTDLVADAIDVRVYHGVHFRTADVQGAAIGRNVAAWIAARAFQPQVGLPPTGAGDDRLPMGWLALASGGAHVVGRLLRRGARRA